MSRQSAIARQWNFKIPSVSLAVNRKGDAVALALGDGSFRLFPANDEAEQPLELTGHKGVSLSLQADADEHAFLSGGDDGKVLILEPGVEEATVLVEHKNQWIDHVAGSSGGQRAYNTGKNVHMLDDEGKTIGKPRLTASSPGGLAFSPNGKRLAASHYNGVTLWWTNAKDSTPVTMPWKGSHLPILWSPDGKMLMTSMQEGALHGWQLSDGKEMQMQGYATKIRSFGFTPRGKYLATSGADQVICWPFFGGGPWGKAPLTLGGSEMRLVTQVAPHPKDEMVAAGYDDGMIVLAPLDGRMEMMVHSPMAATGCEVTGLAWNAAGDCLFASHENGYLSLFTLTSVARAFKSAM